jgi:hypothetical protein
MEANLPNFDTLRDNMQAIGMNMGVWDGLKFGKRDSFKP